MPAAQIVQGLYVIPVGPVNTFLLESADGCTLIDTGLPEVRTRSFKQFEKLASNRRTFAISC